MIADTSVFASSPWHNDSWLTREQLPYDESNEAECVIAGSIQSNSLQGTSRSCSPSFVGSDCSDEFLLNEEESHQLTWDFDIAPSDVMHHTMMGILGDAALSETESDCVVSLDSVEALLPKDLQTTTTSQAIIKPTSHSYKRQESHQSDESSSCSDAMIPSAPSSPSPTKQKQSISSAHRHHKTSCKRHKKWSDLSQVEQVGLVEELTSTISRQLGLREQLEVISIIKPDAAVSPTDTEFVIELTWLNEKKLNQVYDYLDKHHNNSKQAPSKSTHHSKAGCPNNNSINNNGRITKRERRRARQEMRLREKKEQKQVMKEERSGLFKLEQVLSLACSNSDVDDDIDILT